MAFLQLGLVTSALGVTVNGRWEPGIGDPTVFGWMTVGGYLAASVLCWRAAAADKRSRRCAWDGRAVVFWCAMAVLVLGLGINKQLDLQAWLTQVARRTAKAQGWYAYKDQLEGWFVAGLALVGIMLLAALLWASRRGGRSTRVALIGAALLIAFILLRASSFHHVDQWLGQRVGAINLNRAFELCGILCVALGAWMRRRSRRLSSRSLSRETQAQTKGPC